MVDVEELLLGGFLLGEEHRPEEPVVTLVLLDEERSVGVQLESHGLDELGKGLPIFGPTLHLADDEFSSFFEYSPGLSYKLEVVYPHEGKAKHA